MFLLQTFPTTEIINVQNTPTDVSGSPKTSALSTWKLENHKRLDNKN